jgi:phosphoribosyl 1,2-cyclic phosphate phosphodiesterase
VQIDWGPDTFAAYLDLGFDTTLLRHVLVTHAHSDHWTPQEMFYRRRGFSAVAQGEPLTIWAATQVRDALDAIVVDWAEKCHLAFEPLEPYVEREIEPGVAVTPIAAAHAGELSGAQNFIIDAWGTRLLIANDTGWWEEPVWEFLSGRGLDLVVMDCTYGSQPTRGGHLGAPVVVEAKEELARRGALQDSCRFVANHFSHNGGWLHAELEAFLGPHGIEVGFDGMTIALEPGQEA